jgi:hypothetical protein
MRFILAFIFAVSVASAAMVPDQFVPVVPASQVYGGQQVVYVQQPTVVYIQRVEPGRQVIVQRVYVAPPVQQVVVVQQVERKPIMTIGGKHWKVRVW